MPYKYGVQYFVLSIHYALKETYYWQDSQGRLPTDWASFKLKYTEVKLQMD